MKTRHIIGCFGVFLLLENGCQTSTPSPGIEETLSKAGSNREELFHVIRHYQKAGDSLKLQAALFLIENMADKYYYTGKAIDEYYTFIDSVYQIQQEEYDIPAIYADFSSKAQYLKEQPTVTIDVQTLSADYLIENIEEVFAAWNRPWNQHLSFDKFCELILPYRVGSELPESWRQLYRERFEPFLKSDTIQTAIQACTAINNELIKQTIHIAESSVLPIDLRPSTLVDIKFGLCGDYANQAVFAMRAVGIPVAVEIVPHWGDNNNSHVFNVVYDNNKTSHDFSGSEQNPDEHLIRFKNAIPKVYQKTFGKQPNSLAMQHENEAIPPFFMNANLLDVTGNYPFIGAKDITIPLPEQPNRRFAYLCVFDTQGWIPIDWGTISGNKVDFKAVGPNIVYQTALYRNDKLEPVGDAFLLDSLGQISFYTPQTETMEYVLERKHRDANYLDYLPPTMVGGKIQGANRPDFSDAVTFYSFTEEPNFKYTTVTSENPTTPVKYLRYLSSDQTCGNIAELEFYTKDNDTPLKGKVIGDYEPSLYYPRNGAEVMFDGDPLTFFHTNDTLSWGGLELEQQATISKIRYIIRNDDNGIRKGHEYELFYLEQGEWKSLGKQIATEDDRLLYKQMSKGALYWLRDYTKGKAERFFEIKENKVIWH
ncbi:transglutaminase domain-containing protein [Parabacteroides sp. W1-Q-101]|uniref:transglutaminase domain-containing protein n=1 Tax=Parabacteroides TaxID=375288 RepID=UPI00202FD6E6|nr:MULTISPECIES: transglutaminase domain-containing protein [Parabacteroides]MCM0716994.1 transglutaminase domain-containing protein [Parabacteroides sp. W1-Q-101]